MPKKIIFKTSSQFPFLDKSRLPETHMRKKKSMLKVYVETKLPKPFDLYFHSGVTKVMKKDKQLHVFVGKQKHSYALEHVVALHVRHVKTTDWE